MDTNASDVLATDVDSTRRARTAAGLLGVYGIVLAVIAFWPVPVDRGAGRFLRILTEAVPWMTYSRIEFGANVLMFVPFGALVAVILRRRWLVAIPIAAAVSGIIELGQAVFLAGRTSSLADVVANVLGASLGLLCVLVATAVARRFP